MSSCNCSEMKGILVAKNYKVDRRHGDSSFHLHYDESAIEGRVKVHSKALLNTCASMFFNLNPSGMLVGGCEGK